MKLLLGGIPSVNTRRSRQIRCSQLPCRAPLVSALLLPTRLWSRPYPTSSHSPLALALALAVPCPLSPVPLPPVPCCLPRCHLTRAPQQARAPGTAATPNRSPRVARVRGTCGSASGGASCIRRASLKNPHRACSTARALCAALRVHGRLHAKCRRSSARRPCCIGYATARSRKWKGDQHFEFS